MSATYDVVVLGTGGAGLVAAAVAADAGADVALVEKADLVGGTTALSGGTTWLPVHPHQGPAEAATARDDALTYLAALSHGLVDLDLAAAFVDAGPEFVRWLESATTLRYTVVPGLPDYHPEHPGGRPEGGRSLDPGLFAYSALGDWADRVVRPPRTPRMTLTEVPLGGGTGVLDAAERARRRAEDVRGCGHALVGGLLATLLDRGVEPRTGTTVRRLLTTRRDDGTRTVTGVTVADGSGREQDLLARGGVVLATGGFENDPALVRAFLRGPMTSPAGVASTTGDGLRLAMDAGADLAMMREAWWVPTVEVPGEAVDGRPTPRLLLRERTVPGSIMVDRRGRRFTNEAANYNALGGALHQFDPTTFTYANLPCWLVLDAACVRRYGFFEWREPPPWMAHGRTVADLAAAIGVDPVALTDTLGRWNAAVAGSVPDDPEFGRGRSAYDGWNGDLSRYPGAGATLGPITEPPFLAVRVHSGALGTKGGPRTDTEARVVAHDGRPIDGLYAAGNAMAAVTGMVYGGAGGTLGPALTFGFLAGRHAAARACSAAVRT